jgi:hypothetical protein
MNYDFEIHEINKFDKTKKQFYIAEYRVNVFLDGKFKVSFTTPDYESSLSLVKNFKELDNVPINLA